jgi:hypothetical protein
MRHTQQRCGAKAEDQNGSGQDGRDEDKSNSGEHVFVSCLQLSESAEATGL